MRRIVDVNKERIPPILLVLTLATMFVFANDRGIFYRYGHHNWLSSQNMTVAANLSPEHNFLLFFNRTLDENSETTYTPYSRHPILPHLIIKILAIAPLGDNLSAQIYVARILMLLLFAATAFLAYLSLLRLSSNSWVAMTSTLLTCSSYYLLYYADMVSFEIPSIFGVMLMFHGMVVFVQEGRFRQLLVKAGVAIMLYWYVLMLLFPFVVFNLAREAYLAYSESESKDGLRAAVRAVLLSRHMTLRAAALLLAITIWTVNLSNEYFAFDREVPVMELPTVQSIMYRTGFDADFDETYEQAISWTNLLKHQFYRLGGMVLPYIVSDRHAPGALRLQYVTGLVGIGAFAACLVAIAVFAHDKILLLSFATAGFFWSILLRRSSAFHNFESMFHIGIPLILFMLFLLYISRWLSDRHMTGLAIMSAFVFVVSSFLMGQVGLSPAMSESHRQTISDFESIRSLTETNDVVLVRSQNQNGQIEMGDARHAINYYLNGRIIVHEEGESSGFNYDYLVTYTRTNEPTLLTPENQRVFLYLYDHREMP